MQIHEPSPISEEWTSSALKPGATVKDSAVVALVTFRTSPHGLSPSLPLLNAANHDLPLKSASFQPACSVCADTHDVSLTRNSVFPRPMRRSGMANTLAT